MKGKSDIRIELESISMLLADIPVTPVFTVPEGYFSQFPEQILLKIRELEADDPAREISAISPLLAGLPRKMPMEVPSGYFEDLAIPKDVKPLAPVIPVRKRPLSMFAIAASIIAILGFGALLFNQVRTGDTPSSPVNISAELPKVSEKEMDSFLETFPDLASTDPITAVAAPVDVEVMISDVDEEGLREFLSDLPDVQTDKLN